MDAVLVLSVLFALVCGVLIGTLVGARTVTGPSLDPDALAAVDASVHQQVRSHAAVLQQDLRHVSDLVGTLRQERAEQDGRLTAGLRHTMETTARLADTTGHLQAALASPKSRGQWGERMADDVLTAAGFVEGITHSRQARSEAGSVPDYTFHLPKGHVVHMDVKFPIDNYLRWLDADDAERELFAKRFRFDVRNRVVELGDRGYIDPAATVDELLLFIPNESVFGFLHEHDPDLVDFALSRKVVLCSPTSLFAVLAIIRQAVDNFLVERQSDEILASVAGVRDQWERFGGAIEKVARNLLATQRAMEELAGPRSRQFGRQLERLEGVRDLHGPESQLNLLE
jgi:DNA recombination protein RmuC